MDRNCDQCGQPFKARREHARFCSPKCRVYWNREHPGGPPPVTRNKPEPGGKPPGGRPRNWNGKSNDARQRELRAEKRHTDPASNYLRLLRFSLEVTKMCVVLEDYDVVEDAGLDEADLLQVSDVHDDLISLQGWLDRALLATQGYLGEFTTREKIEKLRNTAGRTPEEAKTARRLADRLQRNLEARLTPD